MKVKFKAGNIYRIKYRRYERDPFPLILVLYSKKNIIHAINLNYLTPALTDKVIEMVAQIAQKQLSFNNMYDHYHGWMKKKLPQVIQNGYRTYLTDNITSNTIVANGYWGTKNLLTTLLPKKQVTKVLKNKIKKQVTKQQDKRHKDLDLKTLDEKLKAYVKAMSDNAPKKEKDNKDRFTSI